MKVKDIILTAANELGIGTEMAAYYSGSATAGEEDAHLLLHCFNLVENELALDYLPLYAEDTLETTSGQLYYSLLKNTPVRILSVENEQGKSIRFDLYTEHLKTEPGTVKVRYTYTPKKKMISDSSDFTLLASERLIAYGIAAEYTLAMGRFEESAIWDKKYKEAINAAYALRPTKKMRSRRWY